MAEKKKRQLHALRHIAHGLVPKADYFERKVPTPDKDHIRHGKKLKPWNYWSHLVMNLKCAIRHIKRR